MGFIRTVVKLAAAGAAVSMLLKANRDRKASMAGSSSSTDMSASDADTSASDGTSSSAAWPFPRGRDGADAGGMSTTPMRAESSSSI